MNRTKRQKLPCRNTKNSYNRSPSGRGSARIERTVRVREVGGSNPPAPTGTLLEKGEFFVGEVNGDEESGNGNQEVGIREWESGIGNQEAGIRDEEKGKAVKFSRWLIDAFACPDCEARESCLASAAFFL